ncbi:MAG: DUF692 domain-containing protein [Candidatus Obscuribacterales bacterium]|jgi:uncharacterized protein (UPF0276 family)|nr:DUF692 domain-containing protein [Candidatus Obscuribacterales bacterium]
MVTPSKKEIFCGLALMDSPDFLAASLPLFDAGEVEVLEWSFDIGWENGQDEWASELVAFYSSENRLLGHGVNFSVLSGKWTAGQQAWIERFREECAQHSFMHVSEHFGFSRAGNVIQTSPLPVPYSKSALALGVERLKMMSSIAKVPIGLENLGFAFSIDCVKEQADFINQLLDKSDGFLLLDLHNAFCQIANFGVDAEEYFSLYPLQRVREIHISGGSWSADRDGNSIRRDTHDHEVPEEVFDLLMQVLWRCPNLKTVILERLGNTIRSEEEAARFRSDFLHLKKLIQVFCSESYTEVIPPVSTLRTNGPKKAAKG